MPVDRIAGALLGVHVGDALGATTEFADRQRARRMLPAAVQAAEIVGGGEFDWPPGAATDDTDLTVALVRAYLETDFGTSEAVITAAADHLLRWMWTGPRDIGGATAEGLRAYESSRDPFGSGVSHERSQGNGSLMRTVPVALARRDDAILRSTEASALSAITHAHVVCRDACVAYCDLIAALVTQQATEGGRDALTAAALAARVAAIGDDDRLDPKVRAAMLTGLNQTLDEVEGVNGASSGWVLTALTLAVIALLDERPAAQILLDVARLGGDADTNGAIVGGALGARDGLEAWPDRWITKLEFRDELLAAAERFATR